MNGRKIGPLELDGDWRMEAGKEEWILRSEKKPFPPPCLPLRVLRVVWRISSEKWYCELDRGRN